MVNIEILDLEDRAEVYLVKCGCAYYLYTNGYVCGAGILWVIRQVNLIYDNPVIRICKHFTELSPLARNIGNFIRCLDIYFRPD